MDTGGLGWWGVLIAVFGGAIRVSTPFLFVSLGESVGGISHIVSYWDYRFPKGKPARAAPDEVLEILQEFDGSFVGANEDRSGTAKSAA